ncbi:MAG: hypothetical protein A2142_04440 [candidate division Zixibacteria bacterium RBG_16_48_11]|nr:MAG: hypothetical protein A2142_04440 [candidate division Zixibacteria bacterium RBG_16_48_11]
MKFWSRVWLKWKALALRIARVQTSVLLSLFYFTIFGLYALILRLLGRDLLDKKWRQHKSFWKDRDKQAIDFESAKHQF